MKFQLNLNQIIQNKSHVDLKHKERMKMAKRLKQAIVLGAICLPLLLGTGCERKEVARVKGIIVKEDAKMYDSAWKYDEYRILVNCEDGKKRMYTFTGRHAGGADFKYNVGDKVNLPTEYSNWQYYKSVEIAE